MALTPKHHISLIGMILLLAVPLVWAKDTPAPAPDSPGNIFIRQKAADAKAYQAAVKELRKDFKANGFSAWSLHRDLNNPGLLILTLKCSDLEKGLDFVKSSQYRDTMKKAGGKGMSLWSGADVNARTYKKLPKKPAGIVIAFNQLRSYNYWFAFYNAEHDTKHGGKNVHEGEHYHAERPYKSGNYSIHRGLGKPDSAIVVHEASDVSKAPSFMTAPPMKIMQKPSGITRFEVWYGYNLSQGTF
jgi:hypothetical protein